MGVNRYLKEIADKSCLSVDDISYMTGYNKQRLYEIFNEHSSATPSEAFSICEALGVDLEGLLKCY